MRLFLLTIFFLLNIIPVGSITASTENDIKAPPFDMTTCIKQNTQDCIKAACIAASPDDCVSQCNEEAKNKCNDMATQTL